MSERSFISLTILLVIGCCALVFLQGCPPSQSEAGSTWQEIEAAAPITTATWDRVPGPWGWGQRNDCYWRLRTPEGWVLRRTNGEVVYVPDADGVWLAPEPEKR